MEFTAHPPFFTWQLSVLRERVMSNVSEVSAVPVQMTLEGQPVLV